MHLQLFKIVDREEAKHPAKSHSRHHVKLLSALFISAIFAGMAFAQAPDKIVTFNRADTEHCKAIVASGMPLLQSTYDGTSVAIAMPINRANGDFSIFVSISDDGWPERLQRISSQEQSQIRVRRHRLDHVAATQGSQPRRPSRRHAR